MRAIRLLRRKTLKEVADAAGVSESFVSQIERGRTSASVASLQRLAAALGIEVSDLFATNGLRPRVLCWPGCRFVLPLLECLHERGASLRLHDNHFRQAILE